MKPILLCFLILGLSACSLKGTDSGNPGLVHSPVNSKLCLDESSADCASENPVVQLIDQGLCQTLERCGSSLRSDQCRVDVLNSTVFPEIYPLYPDLLTTRDFAIAAQDKRFSSDEGEFQSCLAALQAPEVCALLPVSSGAESSELRPTLIELLKSNPNCPQVFKKP